MRALLLPNVCKLAEETSPLVMKDIPRPDPSANQILIRVSCCGVCHTELDEIEGRTPPPFFPMVLGHQVVGRVEQLGSGVKRFQLQDRVGVAWIFSACGSCEYCQQGLENLCPEFKATGRDANGGYAEYMVVHEKFAFNIPPDLSDIHAAPLLCAGAIGYRSLRLTALVNGDTLGLTGFGASGHLVLKMCKSLYPNSKILVFARSKEEQSFARSLGAFWAGSLDVQPPILAHAIIDTTPAWEPVVKSLALLHPGGRLVINAIRKETGDRDALLSMEYPLHLWMEKEIKSVANITRKDVEEFLQLAVNIPLHPEVELYPFEDANRALLELKHQHVRGAKVLNLKSKEK